MGIRFIKMHKLIEISIFHVFFGQILSNASLAHLIEN